MNKPAFPDSWKKLRVVLSHDWLTGMRGGEKVLEVLCRGFPSAPIYTLIHNPSAVSAIINAHQVKTSWLQRVPGIFRHYRCFLPAFPSAISGMRPPDCDLVLSTSHCVAKSIPSPRGAKHLCYCFTPMRYAWLFYEEYFGASLLKKIALTPILSSLRRWDRRTADRVDRFVALSRHVQNRIRNFYGRESDVVYPPVDTEYFTPGGNKPQDFDLLVSALVPYKRIDLAVKAYNRLNTPLKIVGIGRELDRLKAMSRDNIQFLGWQPPEALLALYRSCRMLVFPGEEDFGIVPLEAQSCGRPVVAYAKGGALETVREGVTGIFFREQTEDDLIEAVRQCAATAWDVRAIRAQAEQFGLQRFITGLASSIEQCLAGCSG